MAQYLVVAHQTAACPELVTRLNQLAKRDREAELVLLVPATPARHLLTWVEGEQLEIARERATAAATELREAGLTVRDSIVGPSDPFEAVSNELHASPGRYAQVIVSTLPQGLSRWLRRDLPSQVRKLGVPVIHVVARSTLEQSRPEPTRNAPAAAGLADNERPLTLQELAARCGGPLYGQDGFLGDLREVLYDYVSGEPVWLGVASRPLPFRTLLLPAQVARVIDASLVVPLTRNRVLDQPHIDVGEGFASLTDEEHVYRYFGLPFDEVRDIRVLRRGQPIPGTQRNWQNIIEREIAAPSR
jgi:fermentation-respiration switch protein FrsA (DUF1100 family)